MDITLAIIAARSALDSPGSVIAAIWLVVIVVIAICVACMILKSSATRRRLEAMTAAAKGDYRRWLLAVKATGGEFPACSSPLSLDAGEECLYCCVDAALVEPRAIRSGGYGGATIRVAKGVSIHTGEFGAESHDELRSIDQGVLCVTNRRIVFSGSTQTRVIDPSDILSIQASPLRLAINSAKHKRAVVFDGANGLIARDVINAVRQYDTPRGRRRETSV